MSANTNTLDSILLNFKIASQSYSFQTITQGYINDTYLVLDNEAPKYILQRVNHSVFTNVEGLMGNVDLAFRHLISKDYTKIELVSTQTNESYLKDESGFWRLMTYIENSKAFNTTTSVEIAKEAGRIVGEFHLLLVEAPIDCFVDTIPQFHSLALRSTQFEQALSTADSNKLATAKEAIAFTKSTLDELNSYSFAKLPIRVCHNDTKLNNILFSKKTNKALCLIDLDTIMKGYFLYDFGDAIRTIVNTAPEDEQEHSKITFDRDLFSAFVKGLANHKPFLSQEELETLHLGAILLPFLHGIRALTDYLNNNIYYKVAYENQNLDRCLSLFDFTKKVMDETEFMKEVVLNSLSASKN